MKRSDDPMHPAVLADCVSALLLDQDDVLQLRESADLLAALLARSILDARRERGVGVDADDSHARRFCQVVLTGWGESPFTVRELLDWCLPGNTPERRAAMAACRQLCSVSDPDHPVSAVKLGVALKRASDGGIAGDLRLDVAPAVRGVRAWSVRGWRG